MEIGQVAIWISLYLILSALGLPVASVLFARLPGHGAGFASTIALGTITFVAFWVGQIHFGPLGLLSGLLVLVVAAGTCLRRSITVSLPAFAESMAVFTLAFGVMVAIRAYDPGIMLTEAPLNYGMMRATLRASQLPPEDFWFAGAAVRYHYGGHLLAALMTMATGTRPPVAFNLSMAGFYAMLVAGAYELSGTIAAANGRSRRLAGALGAYFVGFAGNLLTPAGAIVAVLPRSIRSPLSTWLSGELAHPAAQTIGSGLATFEYEDVVWTIPDALTPYPIYAWLHGEHHAHMNSAPFLLLVAAVCYAYYRMPSEEHTGRRLLVFVAFPLAAGITLTTDILTAPTIFGLATLAAGFAPSGPASLAPPRLRRALAWSPTADEWWGWYELRRFGLAVGLAAILGVFTVIVAAPFVLNATSGGTETVTFVEAADRTSLVALLVVHGAFMAIFLPHLGPRALARLVPLSLETRLLVVAALLWLVVLGLALNFHALLLSVPLVAIGWYALRADAHQFELVLVVAGAGLVLLAEVAYIANRDYVITGRANTVYRSYMHIWLLWGVAAGVVLPRLLRREGSAWRPRSRRDPVRLVFGAILLLSTATYGGFSVYTHVDTAFDEPDEWRSNAYVYEAWATDTGSTPPTLDGLLWADVRHPHEMDAIRWMDRSIDGSPTILTAPGGRWEWRSPAAMLTGLPTVAGWAHQLVYRDEARYYERVADVQEIYRGSPNRRVELLARYDVRYVYVGPEERSRYDIWAFDLLDGVSVAFENEAVTVYAVEQSELGYTPEPVGTRQWPAEELWVNESVATYHNGTIVATGDGGTLAWYGPAISLSPGTYVATFNVTVPFGDAYPVATVDVVRGAKTGTASDFRVLGRAPVDRAAAADGVVSLRFTLDQPASDVEFRGTIETQNRTVRLRNITVRRTDGGRAGDPGGGVGNRSRR